MTLLRSNLPGASKGNAPELGNSGDTFRMYADSAEAAVARIRKEFGAAAQVLSVRAVKAPGISGVLGSMRLEVIVKRTPGAAAPGVATTPAVAPVVRETEAPIVRGPRIRGEQGPSLERMLFKAGFSESLVDRLRELPDWEETCDEPLHIGLGRVSDAVRRMVAARRHRTLPSVAAFIGPAGSGRTTALCKWMSEDVLSRTRTGSVCSVEFDRPQSVETLSLFCDLLGVSFVRTPVAPEELAVRDSFAYYDMPALSTTNRISNARIRDFLETNSIPGRVLVVSAMTEPALMRRFCSEGADVGCTHVIFTHLDELPTWGKLWNFLVDGPLDPLFLGTGPALSGERETDVIGALLKRTFPIS